MTRLWWSSRTACETSRPVLRQPRYYTIHSGDKPVLMVADYSQKLVRLCVDTDGDGVLSEERCFTAEVNKETPGEWPQTAPWADFPGFPR